MNIHNALLELKKRATAGEVCLIDEVARLVIKELTEEEKKAEAKKAWEEVKEEVVRMGQATDSRMGSRFEALQFLLSELNRQIQLNTKFQ